MTDRFVNISLLVVLALVFGIAIGAACYWAINKPPIADRTHTLQTSRILMHEPYKYSFLVDDTFVTLRIISNGKSDNPIRIVKDVPANESAWVKYILGQPRTSTTDCEYIEIHIHSPEEINGAGWDHGKQGSGQTTVLE